jgi:hypothetical protein
MSARQGAELASRLVPLVVLTVFCFSCTDKNPVKVQSPAASLPATVPEPPAPAPVPEEPLSDVAVVPPPQVEWLAGDRTPAVEKTLDLFDKLWAYERGGHDPDAPRIVFELSDREVNEYLAYSLKVARRPGVTATTLHFLPGNGIRSYLAIDFESFDAWNTYRVPTLLRSLLHGARTVEVDARFDCCKENKMDFTVVKAYGPSGAAMPVNIMEGIFQAIGLAQEELYNTGLPVPLPFGLKRVWTSLGTFGGET